LAPDLAAQREGGARVRATRLPPLPIAALWLALGLASVWYSIWTIASWVSYRQSIDWIIFTTAADRIAGGLNPYATLIEATHSAFRWSPLAAWLFWLIKPLGPLGWAALHLLALAGFRDWRLSLIAGLSWPFIVDLLGGNAMIFIVLVAYWAVRDKPWAIGGYLIATLLIPRPLMLPLAAWLMWRHPEWRWRAAALFAGHALAVFIVGWGPEWISRVADSPADIGNDYNIGPSRFVGAWWLVVGIPLGVWLTWRGRVGLAGLAVSPYVLPYYLLMGIVDLRPMHRARAAFSQPLSRVRPELGSRAQMEPMEHVTEDDAQSRKAIDDAPAEAD
jgi:hypothetical protein